MGSFSLVLLGLLLSSCKTAPKTVVTNALFTLSTSQYRMDVTTVLSDGKAQKSMMEYIPPDTKHILEESTGMEYIIIDQIVYVKADAESGWRETQIPASLYLGEIEQTPESIGEGIKEADLLRTEILDGKAMTVYGYNSTTITSGIELQNQTELWVGDEDGLLYKMKISGDILASYPDAATGEFIYSAEQALTTTLITYDPALKIVAPLP
jgi:hypothetical protein